MKKIIINLKTILILVLFVAVAVIIFARGTISVEKSYFMMDTYVTINAKGTNAKKATNEAYLRLKEIEEKMNHHSDTSKISQKVFDEDLLYVLKKGLNYGDVSNGLFDVTIKPLTILWDVTSQSPKVPDAIDIEAAKSLVDYKKVSVDGSTVTVPESFEIDLGGIAKGYAADEAIKVLKKHNIKDAVINLGGNVYVLGTKRIGIQNPLLKNGDYLGVIKVTDCSVATSGGYERFFIQDGKTYHHIINPFTGYPAETDLLSATVISSSSIDADCLSTILFMSGTEGATEIANKLNVEYVLVDKQQKVYCSENISIEITNDSFEVKNYE